MMWVMCHFLLIKERGGSLLRVSALYSEESALVCVQPRGKSFCGCFCWELRTENCFSKSPTPDRFSSVMMRVRPGLGHLKHLPASGVTAHAQSYQESPLISGGEAFAVA